MNPADEQTLRVLLDEAAARRYGDEAVGELAHALQTAHHAREAGAGDELVLAAALHDVGRLSVALRRASVRAHEYAGAGFVHRAVSLHAARVVAAHVNAKRYLVTDEPGYRERLSAASLRSLERQGGGLEPRSAAAFARLPWANEALALRRWDDAAKVPGGPELEVDELVRIFVRFHARN